MSNRLENPYMNQLPLRIAVAQLGFRLNYAIPITLYHAGMLETIYTDLYMGKGPWTSLSRSWIRQILPDKVKVLLSRQAPIPPKKIKAFQCFGMSYLWRVKKTRLSEQWKVHLWAGEELNRLIIKDGLGGTNCVYGFPSQCLLLFRHAEKNGILRILDQCTAAPNIERDIVLPEYNHWSGWEEPPSLERIDMAVERQHEEWKLADLITCPSEFVKRGIESEGDNGKKLKVVAYGIHIEKPRLPKKVLNSPGPVKVLFIGQVRLLKGIPYLLDAMRQFKASEAICRIVGPIKVSHKKLKNYTPPNVSFWGTAPFSEIEKHYAWADVFCLPTLCEGSAAVIYEALVHGLPVITTANSGSIIESSNDSHHIIVPIKNADAIAEAIRTIIKRKDKRTDTSIIQKLAREASFESYEKRLISALSSLQTEDF
jgi:glycosyltransferase involved in cell wall biosynthesis